MSVDTDRIRGIAERVGSSLGVEVVDVEFLGGGKSRMLRVIIDKPDGVTHEDCANVSRDLSTILDVEEAVPGAASYTLEVSSPGLDRKLTRREEFERVAGKLVKVMTREPVNGNRHFEGRLEKVDGGRILLEQTAGRKKPKPGHAAPGVKVEIELDNVERANLVPEI